MNFVDCPRCPVNPVLIGSIALGLAGAAQCIGTCSRNLLSLAPVGVPWNHKAFRLLNFGFARITAYSVIGIAAGQCGQVFAEAGHLDRLLLPLHILAVLLLILAGLQMTGALRRHFGLDEFPGSWWLRRPVVVITMGHTANVLETWRAGFVHGLIPAPLVAVSALFALTSASPVQGFVVMVLFGLGTGPALLWFGASGFFLGPFLRVRVLGITGLFLLAIGLAALIFVIPRFA